MSTSRDELHALVEGLPEGELAAAQRFLLFLSQESFTDEFAASIRRGLKQADSGETVECRNYSDMVDQILGS